MYLYFIFAPSGYDVHAQPVFNHPPEAGIALRYKAQLISFSDTVDVQPGESMSWDYSYFVAGTTSDQMWGSTDTSNLLSVFPTSDLVENRGTYEQLFYDLEDDGLFEVGINDNTYGPMVYTEPRQVFAYPITYGTAWDSPLHISYTADGDLNVLDGSWSCATIGYGVVTLPNFEFDSALFVECDEFLAQFVNGLSVGGQHATTKRIMVPDLPWPVLQLNSRYWVANGDTIFSARQVIYLTSVVTSVKLSTTDSPTLSVYPNPAGRELNVSTAARRAAFSIADLNGRIVREGESSTVSPNHAIDIRDLPNGMYVLSVLDDQRTVSRLKFTVEH